MEGFSEGIYLYRTEIGKKKFLFEFRAPSGFRPFKDRNGTLNWVWAAIIYVQLIVSLAFYLPSGIHILYHFFL